MGWIADLLQEIPSAARYKVELEKMEKENAFLKAEKAVLQSQVAELRQEIQRRDDLIQKEKLHSRPLDEVKEKILLFLSAQPHGAAILSDHVARQCGVGAQVATHHLEEMNERNLVLVGYSSIEPPRWSLGPEGRSYLVAHGLIS